MLPTMLCVSSFSLAIEETCSCSNFDTGVEMPKASVVTTENAEMIMTAKRIEALDDNVKPAVILIFRTSQRIRYYKSIYVCVKQVAVYSSLDPL